MKKPEDRVVYVCGCAGKVVGPNQGYCRTDNGTPCVGCGQPITAINIDRLLRVKEAARYHNKHCPLKDLALSAALDSNGGEEDGE